MRLRLLLVLALGGCTDGGPTTLAPLDDTDTPGTGDSNPPDTDTDPGGDDTDAPADDTGDTPPPPPGWSLLLPQGTLSLEEPSLAAFPGLVGVPNLDDDDGDGQADWDDASVASGVEDDRVALTVLPAPDQPLSLSLSGEGVRIRSADGSVLLSAGSATSAEISAEAALWVEFSEHLAQASLAVSDGVDTITLPLTGAPLILNHHLMPAEHVWAMDVNYPSWGYSNQEMIADLEDALGSRFIPIAADPYEMDVWVQDEFEFGTATAYGGQRMDTVIDSIRDRGLDDVPEDMIEAPGVAIRTWGRSRDANTYDSFGNLEASPPVTVDGVHYPFGRIYYGAERSFRPTRTLTDFLAAQSIQAPVEIDTSWLCVGHVDEFTAFIPDPTSKKGFRFVFADTRAGYALLDALPGETRLTQYAGRNSHNIRDIEEMRGDAELASFNEDIQQDYLDPMLEVFKAEFGLEDEDIVLMPSLFEEVHGSCAVALIPGTVNLTVANFAGEDTQIFMADPFLRADVDDPSTDPLISAITDLFPASLSLHFVDDWEVYHMGMGEVHCGTNVRRTPSEGWWDYAALLPSGG